ncbi:helix-turn-helix domain-containing protein [Nocardia sp. NPDC050718]|uniref:TetR/AcrR family transcriptional regulator n=1 Tax=Nocardia sp. NPDC050718 TaxID=3155788 RepID=UPI0033DDF0C9
MTRPAAPLSALFERALDGLGTEPDAAELPILSAAIGVLARRGTRAATMDDIAAAAGVSRATLFRRYGNKDDLFARAIRAAVHALLAEVGRIFLAVAEPADRIVETFTACMRFGTTVIAADAEPHHAADMAAVLAQGEPSVLEIAHRFITAQIIEAQEAGRVPGGDPEMKADALLRLTLSYLTPPRRFDLTDPDVVRRIGRTVVAPIIVHA